MNPAAFPLSKIVYPASAAASGTGPAFKPRAASRWCTFHVYIEGTANVSIQGRLLEPQLGADGPLPFVNIVGAAPAAVGVITQSQIISVLTAEEMRVVVDSNSGGKVAVLALDY